MPAPFDASGELTAVEREQLAEHVSDPHGDVFALTQLPEVVKGALFARYSRYGGSLKRLFLDEFIEDLQTADPAARADRLYERVFSEYGDDSVAQLGAAHVAVEGVSNLVTKRLERGRLAAYLEQSTRYIRYDTLRDGRFRYHRPAEILAGPHAAAYECELDAIFSIYRDSLPKVLTWVRDTYPQDADTSDVVYRSATKAKALDLLRGLLPAATTSNVGVFASGQSYESLLLRLRADELTESRDVADRLLAELRKVIPSFLTRVDLPDRGGAWSAYLARTRDDVRALAAELVVAGEEPNRLVTLVDYGPHDPISAEVELATAALYPHVEVSEEQLKAQVSTWSAQRRAEVIRAYVGDRRNRRHRPGRGFERVWYRFDVLGDYGGFRDLQRHRMLTIEWQRLTTQHGYETPPELEAAGVDAAWHEAMERSDALTRTLAKDHPIASQYAVCFAYRVRYNMQINARAAMQMLELRSSPQGHQQYRRVVQRMHELIRDEAGHTAVAEAMTHVDHGQGELERLESERAAERRRQQRGVIAGPEGA